MDQDAVTMVAVALGALAVGVALSALVVTRQTRALVRADPQIAPRREFANLLRRYSELLGVEAVMGVPAAGGVTSTELRVLLEQRLYTMREPGAVELLDEIGDSRESLERIDAPRLAAWNGIIAMQAEWAIERWVEDPRAWLADSREVHRLTRVMGSEVSRAS